MEGQREVGGSIPSCPQHHLARERERERERETRKRTCFRSRRVVPELLRLLRRGRHGQWLSIYPAGQSAGHCDHLSPRSRRVLDLPGLAAPSLVRSGSPPQKRETQEKRKYPTTNFPGNVVLCTILTRSRSPTEREYDRLVVPIAVNSVWKNELKNWGENWGASEGPVRGRGNIEVVGRPTKRRTAAALNLELWEGYARGRQGFIHHGEKCGASVSENPADERGELVAHRAA